MNPLRLRRLIASIGVYSILVALGVPSLVASAAARTTHMPMDEIMPPALDWGPEPMFVTACDDYRDVSVYILDKRVYVDPADRVFVALLESQKVPALRRYLIQPMRF